MRRVINKQGDKFYRMGEELSDEEVLRMLNDYDYAVRTRTLNEREQLIRERAISQHLVRENRLLVHKIIRFIHKGGMMSEDEIANELVEIDDDMIGELQKAQLENEKLKKELYFLKH